MAGDINMEKLPDIDEIRKKTAHAIKENKKPKPTPPPPIKLSEEELQQKENEKMLQSIYWDIESASGNGEDSFYIEIGTQQHESIENKRKRNALNYCRDILRAAGYQTSWKFDQCDYSYEMNYNDIFSVSWNPKIRWNKFRP